MAPPRAVAPISFFVWLSGAVLFGLAVLVGLLIQMSAPSSVSAQLAPLFTGAVGLGLWVIASIVAVVLAIIALKQPALPRWPAKLVLVLAVGVPVLAVIGVVLARLVFGLID